MVSDKDFHFKKEGRKGGRDGGRKEASNKGRKEGKVDKEGKEINVRSSFLV